MTDTHVKGSGGSARLDGTTLTFEFKGLMTSKAKKTASPHAIDLADVARLEYTLPGPFKPGHIRLFLTKDKRVEEASKDPFATSSLMSARRSRSRRSSRR